MRTIILLLLLSATNTLYAQLNTHVIWTEQSSIPSSDIIYYHPQSSLQWKDFQGMPVVNHRAAAITVSGFGYKASLKNIGSKGDLVISVYCFFNKPKSWVKEGHTTSYILAHEQNHFDISYLATNIFIEKLKATNFTTSNMNSLLPKIYTECCDIMNKLQDDYDGQTKNGQVKDAQKKWNEFINEKLDNLTR
ncbi:MAG: hypothetical protein ABIY51_15045 [Ferruginibacter sp.]